MNHLFSRARRRGWPPFILLLAFVPLIGCAAGAAGSPQTGGEGTLASRDYLYSGGASFQFENSSRKALVVFGNPAYQDSILAHYASVCDSYRRLLPYSQRMRQRFGYQLEHATTYWPLNTDTYGEDLSCAQLVEQYDYEIASYFAARMGTADITGTYLLGMATGTNGRQYKIVLPIDQPQPQAIDSVFGIWRKFFASSPAEWDNLTNGRNFSTSLVEALNRFGATIVGVVVP
jgi:hypothetical protein